MRRIRTSPHWRLVLLSLLPVCFYALAGYWKSVDINYLTTPSVLLVAFLAIYDFWLSRNQPQIELTRNARTNLSLGRKYTFNFTIENHSKHFAYFCVHEHHPVELFIEGLGMENTLKSGDQIQLSYCVLAKKRGHCKITGTELRIESKLRLWRVNWFIKNPIVCKVYPDFKVIRSAQFIDATANTSINGLKIYSRRGDGTEFHQLRAYRQGDSLRQIDWCATSKCRKLISREYQEEQNQQIITMLDSGKRMNVRTKTGSHFDVALGALLMLGHTVLNKGDWFSMQSFGEKERWLPNVKGAKNISRVMNHFYDLYPQECASDYLAAAEGLIEKKPKRALVLLVTTLSDESFSDLIPAIMLLRRHHLVAMISIKNQAVQEVLDQEIVDIRGADTYCAALDLQHRQQLNIRRISKLGVICINTDHGKLLPSMLNVYFRVKRSGVL